MTHTDISIRLTDEQVAQILCPVAGKETSLCLRGAVSHPDPQALLHPVADLAECSRTLLRAVGVLASFPVDGTKQEVTAVARRLGLSLTATHRYVRTWTALGLLERDPDSRTYGRTRLL